MSRATAIGFKTRATVLESWRDDDGYGNVDSDYLTMSLRIPTWPPEKTVLARIPNRDPDEQSTGPVVNTTYDMKGEFFYEFPGKDWTRTYLHVDWLSTAATTSSTEQSLPPTFTLIATVRAMTDSKVTVAWETFDPYEGALFTSNAVLQFTAEAQMPGMAIGQRISVGGHADGDGRDQLVAEHSMVLARYELYEVLL